MKFRSDIKCKPTIRKFSSTTINPYFAEEQLLTNPSCILPYFYLDACNSIEAGAYSPVMITEMLSSACVVLLVVVICCMIKLYNMVKIIRPSGNERARVEYARENQRALPVEGEPTLSFPRVEESVRQHCTFNIKPTADYKRYDDSHKCMTNVLGGNVRKIYFVLYKT